MRTIFSTKIRVSISILLFVLMPMQVLAQAVNENGDISRQGSGYMARQESVNGIFDAISAAMRKPVILQRYSANSRYINQD